MFEKFKNSQFGNFFFVLFKLFLDLGGIDVEDNLSVFFFNGSIWFISQSNFYYQIFFRNWRFIFFNQRIYLRMIFVKMLIFILSCQFLFK